MWIRNEEWIKFKLILGLPRSLSMLILWYLSLPSRICFQTFPSLFPTIIHVQFKFKFYWMFDYKVNMIQGHYFVALIVGLFNLLFGHENAYVEYYIYVVFVASYYFVILWWTCHKIIKQHTITNVIFFFFNFKQAFNIKNTKRLC